MPKISVIIPTYNSAKTIQPCLDSIVAQTFTDTEVLIIDGVSTDSTASIVSFYINQFPFIRWISEKDKGIYDAMNKGIGMAAGEWVYFLGSDDTLYTFDTLEKISIQMQKSDNEVLYGNVLSTRLGGVYAGEFDKQKLLSQNICHQSIFLKKSVFQKTGLFNLRFAMHADYDHNFKWFLSDKISHQFMDIIVARYGDNGMSSKLGDYLFLKIKNWKYSYLVRKDLSIKQRIAVLYRELALARKEKRDNDIKEICSQFLKFLLLF